jgi:hypothetical protein
VVGKRVFSQENKRRSLDVNGKVGYKVLTGLDLQLVQSGRSPDQKGIRTEHDRIHIPVCQKSGRSPDQKGIRTRPLSRMSVRKDPTVRTEPRSEGDWNGDTRLGDGGCGRNRQSDSVRV